jgi:type IV pilus assembly protein PilV
MRSMQILKDRRGFTLIEVLLTTVLLSVAFLGMGAMTMGSIRGISFSDNLTTATTLAKTRIEQIEHADYATVISVNYPREDYATLVGYEQFQREVDITLGPEPNMKTVTVIVSWRERGGGAKNVVLATIVAA